jgi:hypothetical protein
MPFFKKKKKKNYSAKINGLLLKVGYYCSHLFPYSHVPRFGVLVNKEGGGYWPMDSEITLVKSYVDFV